MSAVGLGKFRTDIQGMRAIAVLAVVIYHIWPTWLPGGYVGVDVFFVISGYLITGLLARELERTGSISLREFYARRIRRLVPAASVTLFAVACGIVVWIPVADWPAISMELVASAFYVQNWLLVAQQVDYLALDAAPSPVQHFWTLSVEEQFYIFWPVVMLAVAAIAKRWCSVRGALIAALASASLISLGYAIYMSYVDPAPGYFLTTTRIWELGMGGLLALWMTRDRVVELPRRLLGWIGLAAICASAYFYSSRLPFPGYEALLPTVGALAMLMARLDSHDTLGRWLAASPLQYLGGLSYSLYLWHWPVVVFYGPATGRSSDSVQDGVLILTISLILAHASRALVEERFRHMRAGEVVRPFAIAGTLALGVTLSSFLMTRQSEAEVREALGAAVTNPAHPGAIAILRPSEAFDRRVGFVPSANVARLDRGKAYELNGDSSCIGSVLSTELSFCEFGNPLSRTRIVIVGDSHAVHWLPALEPIAESASWRVTGLTKSSCAFTDESIRYASSGVSREYSECRVWGQKALQWLLEQKPDLVILSHSPRHATLVGPSDQGRTEIAKGVARYARLLKAEGIKVAVLQHTPWQAQSVPGCMTKPEATVESCSTSTAEAVTPGTLGQAAALYPDITVIETTPYFCRDEICPVVIGGVLVYRDAHHLTATYATSLAPLLAPRIRQLL